MVQEGIDIWKKNQKQRTALASAARSEQWEIFDFLLGEYAGQSHDRDFLLEKDRFGGIPLHDLCWCSNEDIFKKVFQSSDGEAMCLATDDEMNTPFHIAASEGNIVLVKILLDYNPPLDLPGRNFSHGALPIDQAFHFWKTATGETGKYEEVIELLASRAPVPNVMHKAQFAIEKGSIRLCKLFLDLKNEEDDYGWTPTQLAVQCRNPEIISLLSIDDATMVAQSPHGRFPSRWSVTDKCHELDISNDGMEIYVSDLGELAELSHIMLPEANTSYVFES